MYITTAGGVYGLYTRKSRGSVAPEGKGVYNSYTPKCYDIALYIAG